MKFIKHRIAAEKDVISASEDGGKATQSMSMTTTVKWASERMEELIAAPQMRTSRLEVYPSFTGE